MNNLTSLVPDTEVFFLMGFSWVPLPSTASRIVTAGCSKRRNSTPELAHACILASCKLYNKVQACYYLYMLHFHS